MSLKKFGDKDVFINTMRTFPRCEFLINNTSASYNNVPRHLVSTLGGTGLPTDPSELDDDTIWYDPTTGEVWYNLTFDCSYCSVGVSGGQLNYATIPEGFVLGSGVNNSLLALSPPMEAANSYIGFGISSTSLSNAFGAGSGVLGTIHLSSGDPSAITLTISAFWNSSHVAETVTVFDPATAYVDRGSVRNVDTDKGFISLYEYNIARTKLYTGRSVGTSSLPDTGMIYPWISKNSARSSFTTVGATTYNNEFQYGDILTHDYPLSASISRAAASSNPYQNLKQYASLRNRFSFYEVLSENFKIDGPGGDKDTIGAMIVSIPSIFYGTRINPGTLKLETYYTGSLVGVIEDSKKNGELIQTSNGIETNATSYNNAVAGVVMYDEGIIYLSGSWYFKSGGTYARPIRFAIGCNDGISPSPTLSKYTYRLSFQGQSDTQVMTMFAHARRGEVNYSNNPTFLEYGQDKTFFTSSHVYEEKSDVKLKNFVSSSYSNYSASFERQVFISRVGIFDKNKNLIGVATLANPVLKKEAEDVSFKLRIDI